MNPRRMPGRVGILAVVCVALVSARAEDPPPERDGRKVDPVRRVDLPFEHLAIADDFRVIEGPRLIRDAFPYLAASPRTVSSLDGTALTPRSLRHFLTAPRSEGGAPPARVRGPEAAMEAVRLFLAGPLVTSSAQADRLLEAARGLQDTLKHLEVRITDHRPERWAPTASLRPEDPSIRATAAFDVALVAFEIDRMLRLVHVVAIVTADGRIALERKAIVEGPITTWQTATFGEEDEAFRRREQESHREVALARDRYAKALRPVRDLDAVWAVARVHPDIRLVRLWLGPEDREVTSGVRVAGYDFEDGTSAMLGYTDGPLHFLVRSRRRRPDDAFGETLGTLYAGPPKRR